MKNNLKFYSAFTMVELIFVIVLLGILAAVGSNLLPDNRLLNDTNYITMKIKEKQKNAIGYSDYRFGDELWSSVNSSACIDLDKQGLEREDLNSTHPHKISSSIAVDTNITLCFDEYGRPYQSEYLLLAPKDINVTYNGISKILSVMPMSGYVTLND